MFSFIFLYLSSCCYYCAFPERDFFLTAFHARAIPETPHVFALPVPVLHNKKSYISSATLKRRPNIRTPVRANNTSDRLCMRRILCLSILSIFISKAAKKGTTICFSSSEVNIHRLSACSPVLPFTENEEQVALLHSFETVFFYYMSAAYEKSSRNFAR